MVAYSCKKRFVNPIRVGLGIQVHHEPGDAHVYVPKRQTIRADRKRHARPGEELQLYCGMRTKGCFLIGRARCTEVRSIVLTFGKLSGVSIGGLTNHDGSRERETHYAGGGLDEFATKDGFQNWLDMVRFWNEEHGSLLVFTGVLIEWEPLT